VEDHSLASWKDARLWGLLTARADAARVRDLLEGTLPDIEKVLRSSQTAPLDFTLHDDQHSFRVAERACDLLSPDLRARLSPFEAGQLLLASYCHDIGMNPPREVVDGLSTYIISSESDEILSGESERLHNWFYAQNYSFDLPLSASVPPRDLARLAYRVLS
jgi:hypothetical protein